MVHLSTWVNPALGLDRFFENMSFNYNTGYPHHNIVKVDDLHYRVELALAGFDKKDLSVKLEDGRLTIEGKQEDKDVEYVHHGISTRKFLKSFRLVDTIEIEDAEFTNGILSIKLSNNLPEEKKPQNIKIK